MNPKDEAGPQDAVPGPEAGAPGEGGDPGGVTPEAVLDALRPVQDPELMLSIVDLGLIYGVEVGEGGTSVEVRMTLTSPGCPIGPELMAAVDHATRGVPGVRDAHVQLVWDPPWDPVKMASESAREMLGIW